MNPPSFALLRVEGPDAARHLQGQLACDINALAADSWQFGAYCQVDGRVEALFVIAQAGAEAYELLMPRELAGAVRLRLERYRLRARCTLALVDVAVTTTTSPGAIGYQGPGLDWWLLPISAPKPADPALWQRQVALGTPWLRAETASEFLPQMLGLVELGAISLKKGCYPGQEIVARTHYLGRSKRHLALLAVEGEAAAPGSALERTDDGQASGTLLESGGGLALAVLPESVPADVLLRAAPAASAARFSVMDRSLATKRNAALNRGQRTAVSA